MKMQGQVGYWGCAEGGLAVGFSSEMARWLDAQGEGRRIVVSIERDRQVIIIPDAKEGGVVTPSGDTNHSPFRYRSSSRPTSLIVTASCLPIFGLMDVDFIAEAGCLTGHLPERDHELAWPRLDLDCQTYDPADLAKEALQARLNSLVASGLTTFPSEYRMPMRLRQMLPMGAWAECVATAKTLSGALS